MKKVVVIVLVIILGVTSVIIINNNNKVEEQRKTELKDGKSEEDVILDKVTFSEITNTYEGGVTTLTAKMVNNTEKVKNFTVEVILKDNNGEKLDSMIRVVENLQPNRPKVFTTGIGGDYSHITKIEFKIIEWSEE